MSPSRLSYHTDTDRRSGRTCHSHSLSNLGFPHSFQPGFVQRYLCCAAQDHKGIQGSKTIQVDAAEDSLRSGTGPVLGPTGYNCFDDDRYPGSRGAQVHFDSSQANPCSLLQILGKFIVGYPKSLRLITFIPDDLEFHPPADSLDECHALILSWVSTTSLLIRIDSIAPIHSDDRTNLNEFSLWVVYFSIVLVTSCPRSAVPPPPPLIESRAILRRPLMIKAPTSEAVGVSSCCGSQPYAGPGPSFGLDGSPEIRPLELKDKVNLPTPVLGLQSIIRSQAQCVVHTPGLPATNSLHPENCVDNLRSEITDPVRSEDPASPLLPGMPSTGTERSLLCHSPDVSGPTLIQSFERISGRRITPIIQLGYGQGDDASKIRSSLSLIKVVSMESIPLGSEGDFGLLLQFPAPPKKSKSLFPQKFI